MGSFLNVKHIYKHFDNSELRTMDTLAKIKCDNLLKRILWFGLLYSIKLYVHGVQMHMTTVIYSKFLNWSEYPWKMDLSSVIHKIQEVHLIDITAEISMCSIVK